MNSQPYIAAPRTCQEVCYSRSYCCLTRFLEPPLTAARNATDRPVKRLSAATGPVRGPPWEGRPRRWAKKGRVIPDRDFHFTL
jgi:hypothetical protein